ncbi:MAG TPA: hypothetical protein VKH81_08300 [Candidatus Angelobacter sp.]|nr:hypothetical protein [Candidatus Angelobacter sp.]
MCASAQQNSGAQPPRPQTAAPATPEKSAEKRPSPEDRQRLVAIAHKLEAAPLDRTLSPERNWAVQWVVAAPDLHVRTCSTLLSDLRRPRYKYRSELSNQLLISSAAFLIEHPEKGDSIPVQSTGGMEGVLKAYSAIVKTDPQAKTKSLDDLLQKQKQGKLAKTVQEAVKDCH